jgi:small-conductance mechanosensitive channel
MFSQPSLNKWMSITPNKWQNMMPKKRLNITPRSPAPNVAKRTTTLPHFELDQCDRAPTGRKVAFVNSYAIEGHFFNFTTSGQWMWDELEITVPFNQDPYPLLDAIQKTVAKETETNAEMAAKEWESATSHYKVRAVSATPEVNLRPTAAGVEVHVRYITRAPERSAMRARLNQALVQLLHQRGAGEKSDVAAAR